MLQKKDVIYVLIDMYLRFKQIVQKSYKVLAFGT